MAWELLVILAAAAIGLIGSIWTIVVGFQTSTAWGAALLLSYLGAFLILMLPLLGLIFPLIWLIIFLIFSFRHWRYVKIPAVIVLVALVAQIAAGYSFAVKSKAVLQTVQQRLQSGEMDRDELRAFLFQEMLKEGLLPSKSARREKPVRLPEAVEEQAMDQMEAQEAQATNVSAERGMAEVTAPSPGTEIETLAEAEESTPGDSEAPAETEGDAKPGIQPITRPVKPDPLEIKLPETPAPLTKPVSLARAGQYLGEYFLIEDTNGVLHEGRLRAIREGRYEFERKVYNGIFSFQLPQENIKRLRLRLEPPKDQG